MNSEKNYTLDDKQCLLFALKDIADAVGSRFAPETFQHVERAVDALTEFINATYPAPDFDETLGDVSAGMHIYLRKNCNSAASSLLHRMFDVNTGHGVWHALCVCIHENITRKRPCLNEYENTIANYYRQHSNVPGNYDMYLALKAWFEYKNGREFLDMLKEFKSGELMCLGTHQGLTKK